MIDNVTGAPVENVTMDGARFQQCELPGDGIERYGRQMLLRDWGPGAQCAVNKGRVLIIGAGGLGCPVSIYLAGAGVGHIAIIDNDRIEKSNIHRQVLHRDDAVGESKAVSAVNACKALNPSIELIAIQERFEASNALSLVQGYDVLVDATDNVESRYLINDIGVMTGKPIVCGSALGFEGQLTVYGYRQQCCYRCVFPNPPPREAIGDCNNAGVLGPIPAIIGTMQALEVLKLLANVGEVLASRLLLFDGLSMTTHIVRLRGRDPNCAVCGDNPSITSPTTLSVTCSNPSSAATVPSISIRDFVDLAESPCIVIDVRERQQYEICSLDGSRNIPLSVMRSNTVHFADLLQTSLPIYCICRRGFLSRTATSMLIDAGAKHVYSVEGGLRAYSTEIDPRLPIY